MGIQRGIRRSRPAAIFTYHSRSSSMQGTRHSTYSMPSFRTRIYETSQSTARNTKAERIHCIKLTFNSRNPSECDSLNSRRSSSNCLRTSSFTWLGGGVRSGILPTLSGISTTDVNTIFRYVKSPVSTDSQITPMYECVPSGPYIMEDWILKQEGDLDGELELPEGARSPASSTGAVFGSRSSRGASPMEWS